MTTSRALAEAFSGHRFADTYDHLAEGVRWVVVGGTVTTGREAVVAACEQAAVELGRLRLERQRFLVVAEDDRAAVDTVTRYVDPSGEESVVASCDVYELEEGEITTITSYAVEL